MRVLLRMHVSEIFWSNNNDNYVKFSKNFAANVWRKSAKNLHHLFSANGKSRAARRGRATGATAPFPHPPHLSSPARLGNHRSDRLASKDTNEQYWIILNNSHIFQNFRRCSNLFSQIWLKKATHVTLFFNGRSGRRTPAFFSFFFLTLGRFFWDTGSWTRFLGSN